MNLKQRLLTVCDRELDSRISELKQSLNSVQQSKASETKSSAGDKYETARAMMQIEEERLAGQLAEMIKMRTILSQIDPEKSSPSVEFGSLVTTKSHSYFISVPLGKLQVDGEMYYCISVNSPIGKALLGKRVEQEVRWNSGTLQIKSLS